MTCQAPQIADKDCKLNSKTMNSISIATYNGIKTTLLCTVMLFLYQEFGTSYFLATVSNVQDNYIGSAQKFCFNGWWLKLLSKLIRILRITFCYKQLCGRCLVHMTPVIKVVICTIISEIH